MKVLIVEDDPVTRKLLEVFLGNGDMKFFFAVMVKRHGKS